jgi:uncharacterized protein (DUF2225 family)
MNKDYDQDQLNEALGEVFGYSLTTISPDDEHIYYVILDEDGQYDEDNDVFDYLSDVQENMLTNPKLAEYLIKEFD